MVHSGHSPELGKQHFKEDREGTEAKHLLAEWKNVSQKHMQSTAESSTTSLEVIKCNR